MAKIIKTEEQKQAAIEELAALERAVDQLMSYDIPISENIIEEKHALEEAIADFNAKAEPEVVEQEAEEDAPFHRVFLLVEINQDDIEAATIAISNIGGRCYRVCNP